MELIKIVQKSNLFIIRMLLQMSNDSFCHPPFISGTNVNTTWQHTNTISNFIIWEK